MESGISPTQPAKVQSVSGRGSSAGSASIIRRQRQTASIATNDCPGPGRSRSKSRSTSRTNVEVSFRFVLSLQLAENLLGFLHVLERELTGFNQVRHHGLRAPAKHRQQIVDQLPLRGVA